MSRESTIDQLNSFLRGEISAVETYRQAMEKVKDVRAVTTLEECQTSHARRVANLREFITRLGGTPSTDSGAWGSFAKLVEGSAAAFGDCFGSAGPPVSIASAAAVTSAAATDAPLAGVDAVSAAATCVTCIDDMLESSARATSSSEACDLVVVSSAEILSCRASSASATPGSASIDAAAAEGDEPGLVAAGTSVPIDAFSDAICVSSCRRSLSP